MHIQVHHARDAFGRGLTFSHIENFELLHRILNFTLTTTGLYHAGYSNYLVIPTVRNEVQLPNLPPAFDGFTILHLSDLHLDLDPLIGGAIAKQLPTDAYDLCVVTGDFRERTDGETEPVVALMAELAPHLKAPTYAILGNHDFIEMVPGMEALGMSFLLNENVALERDGTRIHLAGVDDPHFYQTDNFEKATEGIPQEEISILLAHTPEVYRKAAGTGFDLMLCGHTHAGQICLPGGRHIVKNVHCPNMLLRGAWKFHGLRGYTSPGTGSSGVPVRFFCPPKITLHTLRGG